MDNFILADAHCDTISRIHDNREGLLENSGHLDIKRCLANNVGLQFFAVWVNSFCKTPFKKACEIINTYHEQTAKNLAAISKVRSRWDIDETKLNAMLTLEGGNVLEGNLENLQEFYNMGARLLTLTWNGENELGYGAWPIRTQMTQIYRIHADNNKKKYLRKSAYAKHRRYLRSEKNYKAGGLKPFGIEVVRKMEELGMIIDVSHISDAGFWDVIKHTKKSTPIFATHSNCKAICPHPRNLTDEQIKAIIERNGFIGLNLYPDFLGEDNLDLIVKHAKHIINLGGENVLGFGFDFDGVDKLPQGISGIENAHLIIETLSRHFNQDLLRKICGNNLISKISL